MVRLLLVWRRTPDQQGASSVEYALIVSLIAVVIIGAVTLFGGNLADLFQRSCESVATAAANTC